MKFTNEKFCYQKTVSIKWESQCQAAIIMILYILVLIMTALTLKAEKRVRYTTRDLQSVKEQSVANMHTWLSAINLIKDNITDIFHV